MKKILFLLALLLALFPLSASAIESNPFSVLAGDVLQITVWKEDGLDREALVLPNGDITFPLIGTLKVQGLTPAEIQYLVKKSLEKFIPDAFVTVQVKAALGHTVSVLGQVAKPGEIILSHRMTALQALSQAGGLTPYADESEIIVIRHGKNKDSSLPVSYDKLSSGNNLSGDVVLEPGDVLVVPTETLF
ncbi:MAG: polysaccharide export protein [Alphaproteobacteria bacterium]|nr:polysaccharide export protein [Alphaproteobacteria bacterium]